ncbi:sensor histidine kinase [Massilia forsythiae]|uniref:histidine kinase n=1 Tax=Massilia forsythiae TaxID=2728020 RepID=A0A7Z2ZUT4_9BURK|nr:ATP-binding protein [Massilia forsythiae]QJE01392.1 sensor histidine kinase [Massilia forsythiae]
MPLPPTLRTRFTAYLLALHLPLFGCATLLLPARPALFVGAEAALAASLALGWLLLRRALEPLGYTRRFHELLQDQQYAGRLAAPGMRELDDLVGMFNAMLDALHRERLALGEQQGFLDRLLEATPGAVLVFDFDRRISLLNAGAAALLGLAQPLGRPLSHWADEGSGDGDFDGAFDARARERSRDLARQLDALPLHASLLLTDTGGRRYRARRGQFFDRGFARHFLLVEELTAELEDSERATYERLIRVLAHEVNNTVAATGSVLDSLLYYRGQLARQDGDDFATAIVAARRRNASLGEFIDRFTHVVKMPALALRAAALGDVVDDILWLNRETCQRRGIALGWGRRDAAAPMALDVQLVEQALLNIVKNAIEAVEARRAALAHAEAAQMHDAAPAPQDFIRVELAHDDADGGRRMRLSVIDSGGQLGAVPVRRLFTPFFSTKKGGQGIGLMFVREVLNRHGCTYSLAPGADGETRFDIWFPADERTRHR